MERDAENIEYEPGGQNPDTPAIPPEPTVAEAGVEAIVFALAAYYDEWSVSGEAVNEWNGAYPETHFAITFTRTVQDPEKIDPDEIDVCSINLEARGTAYDWDSIDSDWEPNDPCVPTIETIARTIIALAAATPQRTEDGVWVSRGTLGYIENLVARTISRGADIEREWAYEIAAALQSPQDGSEVPE